MSFKHALYVLNDARFTSINATSRHLLLVLALHASDRGNVCWPGEERLMKETGMSRATLYRAKGPLRDLIEIDPPGYKRSNCYYFPPVDTMGKRLTEVAKVLEAKREQEMEAKGELESDVDNVLIESEKLSTCQQESQNETPNTPFLRLKMRPLPSQNETDTRLKMRPELKDEYKKKSVGLLPSQIETSQNETSASSGYDGSTVPRCKADYEWIKRHCRVAGMDKQHTNMFLAKHRPWGWNALRPGVNICDLIADYVTLWQESNREEWKYVQECIKNGVL